jgi:hypothetical protein
MPDLVTQPSRFSSGDRRTFIDDAANVPSFEPSDVPGFLHPAGNNKLYVPASNPGSPGVTKAKAIKMSKGEGGALYQDQ